MKTNSITGGSEYQQMVEFAKILQTDCSRYLNDSDALERGWLFRMMIPIKDVTKEVLVNTQRKPRDTPLLVHKIIDDYFFEIYGIPFRSSSVFCVNNPSYITQDYPDSRGIENSLHLIFPIGDYTSLVSKKYRDLTLILSRSYGKEMVEISSCTSIDDVSEPTKNKILDFLNRGDYVLNDLFGNNVNEIMLYCKSYYALDISGKNYSKIRYLSEILSSK